METAKRKIFPQRLADWRLLDWRVYSGVAAAALGMAAVGVTAQHVRRPRDLRWLDHVHVLPHPTTSNFRVIDGIRIHYQEHTAESDSEVVIMLHGFCSSNYTWKDCFNYFSEAGYRVIAPDLKGFGFSEKPLDKKYNIKDQVNIIIRLMDSLGIKQATLVGNSYGGAISMACALAYPEKVKQLILIAAAHNNEVITHRLFRGGQWLVNNNGIDVVAPFILGSPNVLRYYMNKMFHNKSVLTEERYNAYLRPLRTANCQMAAITTIKQWDLSWLANDMSNIKAPTLLIWGEQDWAVPVEWGAEIHLAIKHSQFVVIPECGHLPQEEMPVETSKLILDFCRQVK